MKRILFYGDSNTYGYDPRSAFGGRYPEEVRWIDRLKAEEDSGWEILAEAMNGRELPAGEAGLERVSGLIRRARESGGLDWFAVMLGTNDLFGAPGPASGYAAAKMDALLKKLREDFPELSLLVIAPPLVGAEDSPDPEFRYYRQENRQMNMMFHLLAERYGADYLDAGDWDLPMAFDLVHLSEAGHRLFAEEMGEWLRERQEESI